MFMYHHRVILERREGVSQFPRVPIGLEITSERRLNGSVIHYRPPTYEETSAFWKVPASTITKWWKNQDKILSPQRKAYSPAWPDLEKKLYEDFLVTRQIGKLVTVGWFRQRLKKLFAEVYPESNHLFTFSHG